MTRFEKEVVELNTNQKITRVIETYTNEHKMFVLIHHSEDELTKVSHDLIFTNKLKYYYPYGYGLKKQNRDLIQSKIGDIYIDEYKFIFICRTKYLDEIRQRLLEYNDPNLIAREIISPDISSTYLHMVLEENGDDIIENIEINY
jgi:hypothetical protein